MRMHPVAIFRLFIYFFMSSLLVTLARESDLHLTIDSLTQIVIYFLTTQILTFKFFSQLGNSVKIWSGWLRLWRFIFRFTCFIQTFFCFSFNSQNEKFHIWVLNFLSIFLLTTRTKTEFVRRNILKISSLSLCLCLPYRRSRCLKLLFEREESSREYFPVSSQVWSFFSHSNLELCAASLFSSLLTICCSWKKLLGSRHWPDIPEKKNKKKKTTYMDS